MSEQQIEQDEYEDPNESSVIKKLRAEAKQGREATARADSAVAEARAAQRELAMRRAGVDVESPLGALFNKGWDGEVDVDAMREGWAAVSGSAPQGPDPRQAALERISGASGGSAAVGGAPVDFENELDQIPLVVDGQYNPEYVNQVLSKTAEQAAREGRQFGTSGAGARKWSSGGASVPATTPLR